MRIRDASGWTMFIFGVMAFLLGALGIVRPELQLSLLGFEVVERAARASSDYTLTFMTAASIASVNIGIYYVLAALNDVKIFYRWTVPFRMLTVTVFFIIVVLGIAPLKFIGVPLWELTGAIATGITLMKENQKKS